MPCQERWLPAVERLATQLSGDSSRAPEPLHHRTAGGHPSLRRFLVSILLVLLFVVGTALAANAAELDDAPVQPRAVRKVFGDGNHNAFTALTRFKGDLWLAFRTAKAHTAPDGDIVVLRSSDDGKTWTESHRVNLARDDRDPQFLVLGKRLILYDQAINDAALTCYAIHTEDGERVSEPKPVYEPAFVLWKPALHNGKVYSATYTKGDAASGKGREARFIESEDGLAWKTVSTIGRAGSESESTLFFGPGDHATVFLRQKRGSPQAQIFEANPPYTDWNSRPANVSHFAGHSIHAFQGVTYFFTRTMDEKSRQAGLMIYIYADGKMEPYCRLPAGGDCAYAEAVEVGDNMLVSYYSSHEGATNVYVAEVPLKGLSDRKEGSAK